MAEIKSEPNRRKTPGYSFYRIKTNGRGFTLLELLLAIFIFSLVMITVVALFARFVTFQKRATAIQRNMEDARYAMELMAKTLRTSSVVDCLNNSGVTTCSSSVVTGVRIYDYSQGRCIVYRFNSGTNKLESGSRDPDLPGGKDNCDFGAITPARIVNNNINNVAFSVTQSVSGVVGRVTVSTEICSTGGCSGAENDKAALQTTVSLRDYVESNP